MDKGSRIQVNLRVDKEDLDMIEALRRAFTPIPPATAIWRQALREMHERHVKTDKRRK